MNSEVIFNALRSVLGDKVTNDPVRRFAWSTDASYFRIMPQWVVHADTLADVQATLATAREHKVPV
ncbi:MAG: hypothetical protein ACRCT7_12025, partial [Shewanella sp.]